jgi:tRNA pseudouridine38-40 synthase
MHNIKLTIEYDGTNYVGWQTQKSRIPNLKSQTKTIQETIEKALKKIFQKRIKLIGSGRTDAGVHAQGQVANFRIDSDINSEKLKQALNAILPSDIAITKIEEVGLGFHGRFSAQAKNYRDKILNRTLRSAFLRDKAYYVAYPLDLKLMRREAGCLLGRHNFQSFQAADKNERKPVKTIKRLKITKDKDLIYIDIEANGFLYNMVRNIVGTLIEIGRGKLPEGSLKRILLARNRKRAGPTAPAKGLCLLEVKY